MTHDVNHTGEIPHIVDVRFRPNYKTGYVDFFLFEQKMFRENMEGSEEVVKILLTSLDVITLY